MSTSSATRARAIMVLGTSSHVGKSLLVAALCRLFARHGVRVAPFKSQNMSLNSGVTPEGLEIGRAQALQAEAAGIPASVDMNPILIKPTGNMSSQVVVQGKIWGNGTAAEYHRRRVKDLLPIVQQSYARLAAQYDVIVLEGAGSPAEINLKQHDLVNMRMADMADARCLLVGDIDRGGVFASLLGTIELLDPHERDRIEAFAINKFRGDLALLMPGVHMMEDRLRKPCLGVLPFLHDLDLEEEDSLGHPAIHRASSPASWPAPSAHHDPARHLRIAVIALPTFSNFTDFDALRAEPSVDVRFIRSADQLAHADILILPGSKQTVDDLLWLRAQGLDRAILLHARTSLLVGICGGMQMLGEEIADPLAIERDGCVPGLGLLPFRTTMRASKLTRLTRGDLAATNLFGSPTQPLTLDGYEIHVGETSYSDGAAPFASVLRTGGDTTPQRDGCISPDTRIFGTYLHGLFDQDDFRHAFIASARTFHGLHPATRLEPWKQRRTESLDRLADAVAEAWDMERIFSWVGLPYPPSTDDQAPASLAPTEALPQELAPQQAAP